jgi:hypothetical protein
LLCCIYLPNHLSSLPLCDHIPWYSAAYHVSISFRTEFVKMFGQSGLFPSIPSDLMKGINILSSANHVEYNRYATQHLFFQLYGMLHWAMLMVWRYSINLPCDGEGDGKTNISRSCCLKMHIPSSLIVDLCMTTKWLKSFRHYCNSLVIAVCTWETEANILNSTNNSCTFHS